jgi:hypothetical protein
MLAAVAGGSSTNNMYLGVHWPPNRDEVVFLATTYGPKALGA